MTPIQKIAKLALDNPDLKSDLMTILRDAGMWQDAAGPETTDTYENKIDHGYDQALGGGTDVMKRLQDQFLIEQGREPRDKNPRLAATQNLQASLISLLNGPYGRSLVETAVIRYAADTNTTIVINAAVDDIINNAVAVALDPQRMGQVITRHTAKEQ